jgi:hypothetical protein
MNLQFLKRSCVIIVLVITSISTVSSQESNFKKYVKINGNVSATAIFYNARSIEPRKDPFSYILSGNLNVTVLGTSLPFSFTVSNRNSKFRQPFNQFGFSPSYKWITLHLGYRNIKFDPLVMNGHQLLGVGVELNPGIFRFGFIWGRFKREINVAHTVGEPHIDSVQQFTRKGYSVKLGIGNKKNFFDLIFLQVADDTLSLENYNPDNTMPASGNTALGLNTRLQFTQKLFFELSTAYSLYTTNLSGYPLVENNDKFYMKLVPPINSSTEHYYAIKSALTYQPGKHTTLSLNYRRIQPGYKTMGMYFIQSDAENITMNMSFAFWKNKIHLSGSVGTERNNLNKARESTTRRWVGSANLNFAPTRSFSLTANYANFSINQRGDEVQIADSVKLYQTNSQLSFMPRYIVFGKKVNHVFMFMFNSSQLKDKNPYTSEFTDFHLTNYMFTYNVNFMPSAFGVTATYNYAKVNMVTGKNTNQTISLGLNKSLLKRKLLLRFNQLFTFANNNNQHTTLIRPAFTAIYKPARHHQFKFHFIYKKNKAEVNDFSETTVDISYLFTY